MDESHVSVRVSIWQETRDLSAGKAVIVEGMIKHFQGEIYLSTKMEKVTLSKGCFLTPLLPIKTLSEWEFQNRPLVTSIRDGERGIMKLELFQVVKDGDELVAKGVSEGKDISVRGMFFI